MKAAQRKLAEAKIAHFEPQLAPLRAATGRAAAPYREIEESIRALVTLKEEFYRSNAHADGYANACSQALAAARGELHRLSQPTRPKSRGFVQSDARPSVPAVRVRGNHIVGWADPIDHPSN